MALALMDTQIEVREILLHDKPPSMLEASPKGTVPVFITAEGQLIEESLDLVIWAIAENSPQWLQYGGLEQQKAYIEKFDSEFKPLLDAYKYTRPGAEHPASYYRDLAEGWLDELEQSLLTQEYLLGDLPQMQDIALMPFIRQFAFVDKQWFDEQPRPNLSRWLESWLKDNLFTYIMKKYPQWQEGTCGEIWRTG
jgi:glutathione S-transferase